MKRTIGNLALALFVMTPAATTAQGFQQSCGNRASIIERLELKWGESFAGGGLHNASSVFEIWMSSEKGTWTILKTHANGTACVMASGTNWLATDPSRQVAGIKG